MLLQLLWFFLNPYAIIGNEDLVSLTKECKAAANEKDKECASIKNLAQCWNCTFIPPNCEYGADITANCAPYEWVNCKNPFNFVTNTRCEFCWQTKDVDQSCTPVTNCSIAGPPSDRMVIATCRVKSHVFCKGNRIFQRKIPCSFTSGYKWSTALLLSITLGGFGADRFYLGLWREGLGKLFSFGGLGVWTVLDVILIAVGYVRPADGSLYM